jgi:hypothetical protein
MEQLLLIVQSRHVQLLLQISPQNQDVNPTLQDAQQRAEVVAWLRVLVLLPMFKLRVLKMLAEQSVNGIQ